MPEALLFSNIADPSGEFHKLPERRKEFTSKALQRAASYSDEQMHAALDVDILNYPSAIMTTNEVVDSISSGLAPGGPAD